MKQNLGKPQECFGGCQVFVNSFASPLFVLAIMYSMELLHSRTCRCLARSAGNSEIRSRTEACRGADLKSSAGESFRTELFEKVLILNGNSIGIV